jgi:hypothetical protein
MTTHYQEIRGQAAGINVQTSAPTTDNYAGRTYVDNLTGKLYIYGPDGVWRFASNMTSTSTSTTSSSSSSTSSTSSSTSSTSSSTSSTSSSSSSTSTSTTLL